MLAPFLFVMVAVLSGIIGYATTALERPMRHLSSQVRIANKFSLYGTIAAGSAGVLICGAIMATASFWMLLPAVILAVVSFYTVALKNTNCFTVAS